MRIFLFILLFDIIFRSMSVLVHWEDWGRKFEMKFLPRRLPTAAECREMAETASEQHPDPVGEDVDRSLESLWRYLLPYPQADTKKIMEDVESDWEFACNVFKFAYVWVSSRLDFVENVIGFNQEWPMFSPNVGKRKWLTRARLTYADGDQKVVRNHADPPDLLTYSHWNQEKVLDFELRANSSPGHEDECFGYCNLLAHRHSHNDEGAALVTIRLYEVKYDYAPPGVDYEAFYREQMARTAERWPAQDNPRRHGEDRQVYADFYEFEVGPRKGRRLDD